MLRKNRIIKNEERASKHINVLTHYDDHTLLDKSGKLIQIIKMSGLNFITQDKQSLDIYKNRRNNLLKSFSSEFALYFWEVRRRFNQMPAGHFESGFAKMVNENYQQQMKQADLFHNELYLAVITKQPEGLINKGFSFWQYFSLKLDKETKKVYLAQRNKKLSDATRKILSALSNYGCELLGVYEKNGIQFSAPLEFISFLINGDTFRIPLNIADASQTIPRKRFFFNNKAGTVEIRSADHSKKFAAMLSIKGYCPVTYQGILNQLNRLRCEYTLAQSFRFYDRQVAKGKLRDQQHEMMQSNEESESQTDAIEDAFDDTASGNVGYGKHHFSLACYADTQEELNKHVGGIVACFSDVDIACVREDVATECAFWAQLPGNFSYIARAADISTRNMASLASLHNTPLGRLKGNHWGDAVTLFETRSGSPYYFNFHYKDVGNFLVFGAIGSGKTVLIGFLILQSMKFGGKRIIFDKDRGLEILVRAMGGVYAQIKPGKSTGFNPCQLDDTSENRKFLALLFKKMLTVNGETLSEQAAEVIEQAITGLYRLEQAARQLCHLSSFFGTKKSGSLRARFDQWHSDGQHAWVFDHATDTLNLNPDVMGFDLGALLDDSECKTPILMYLFYRVEKALEGQRGMLFCDEGWQYLADDYFKERINDWSRTPRKKNNIFGLATQVANDTVSHSISKAINESSFCKIFFPNPSADKKVYIDGLGLAPHHYELIKTMSDDQHEFLLEYGRGSNKESVILRANLTGLEKEIAVISAREESLAILDQVRSEVGDDPQVWLPLFYSRLQERGLL